MHRTTLIALVLAALALLLAPVPARAQTDVPGVARLIRLMERAEARFEAEANRAVKSALKRISILERKGVSDDRLNAVINETKLTLEVRAAAMRSAIDDFEAAAGLVITRHQASRAKNGTLPTINFDEVRRRVASRADRLKADADATLDEAFADLDAAAPAEEPEEEFIF